MIQDTQNSKSEQFTNTNTSQRTRKPRWIVVHYTACLASAEAVARSMKKNGVSTNYIVDGSTVLHEVDEKTRYAWHCATKHKVVFCDATNANSIGVDLCEKKKDKTTRKAEDPDWFFDEITLDTAARLISQIMRSYNISLDRVVRHYDVTHKMCPRPFVGDDLNTATQKTGNENWAAFKSMILNYYNGAK